MIGTHLEAGPRLPVSSVVFFLLGLAILGLSATMGGDPIAIGFWLFAIWPFSYSFIAWRQSRRFFDATLEEESITITRPITAVIPYSTIKAVQIDVASERNYPLHVHHEQGIVCIPAHAGVKTIELLRFLTSRMPPGQREHLPDELQKYYDTHAAKFGTGQMIVFTPRLARAYSTRGEMGRALGLSFSLAGLCWLILGQVFHSRTFNGDGWSGMGTFVLISGLIVYWMFRQQRALPGGLAKWHHSGLVLSPMGLALIQGKTRGEMKWGEMTKLLFPTKQGFLDVDNVSRAGNIRLDFGGAGIEIVDIYCHPLFFVHEKIKGYWQV